MNIEDFKNARGKLSEMSPEEIIALAKKMSPDDTEKADADLMNAKVTMVESGALKAVSDYSAQQRKAGNQVAMHVALVEAMATIIGLDMALLPSSIRSNYGADLAHLFSRQLATKSNKAMIEAVIAQIKAEQQGSAGEAAPV